jgi:predicted AlkP superfamily pyrophosphatase or phosphodiesterase
MQRSPRRHAAAFVLRFLLLAPIVVSVSAPAGAAGAPAATDQAPVGSRHVVLFSIDGMASGYLERADALGLAIPNLRRLQREGTTAEGARSVMPSITYPSHTTMITGVNPTRHGITANGFLDPLDPAQMRGEGSFVFYEDIKVPTLFDAVRAKGGISAAVWWPVTVDAPIDYNFPDFDAPTLHDVRTLLHFSSPEARALAGPPAGLIGAGDDTELDVLRTRIAIAFLQHRPQLLAVHLIALDGASHQHGPYGREALAALESVDRHLGELIAAIQAAGLWNDTTLVVTSDHGFVPVERQVRLGALFATVGLLTAGDDGEVTSWAAYPWTNGGSAAIYLNPAAPATALPANATSAGAATATATTTTTTAAIAAIAARVDRALDLLTPLADFGIHRLYRGAEVEALQGFPGAYAVLDTEPGFTFSSQLTGPIVAPTTLRGVHGQAPDRHEVYACLLLRGPGIRAGARIPTVRLLDIAPTIAQILGLDLASGHVEGRVLNEIFSSPPVP